MHYFWKMENFETEGWGALLLKNCVTLKNWKFWNWKLWCVTIENCVNLEDWKLWNWRLGCVNIENCVTFENFLLWKLRYFENCVSFEKLRYFEKLSYCKRKVLRWGALLLKILYYFENFALGCVTVKTFVLLCKFYVT